MPFETLTAADGHTLSAFVAGPADAKRGLVVVQEIFGVNHHMRDVCERFARKGYAVVAPALFDRAERGIELGYQQADVQRGLALRSQVRDEDVLADVTAAAHRLRGKKIGIVGYCWGGTIAWMGATRTRLFGAASGWYGGGIAAMRHETPHCPVQLHFGEQDHGIPMLDVENIREAQDQNAGVTIYVYDGAQHGFGCDARPSFSKPDYELAQERTLAFFAEHLG
jgi:carboxymethylenebutenolidase